MVHNNKVLQLINEGKFIQANGEEEMISDKRHHVPLDLNHKKQFASNNGILAFADPYGNVYVGADKPENRNALVQEEYHLNSNLTVPFSRGYNPNSSVEQRLNELREIKTSSEEKYRLRTGKK